MQGNWLTKTKKAYVYRVNVYNLRIGEYEPEWCLTLLHGHMDTEAFWFPTFELAVKAIPKLWRH